MEHHIFRISGYLDIPVHCFMHIENLYIEARTDSWRDVNAFLKQQIERRPDDVDTIVCRLYFLIDLALEGPVREQIDFVKETPEIGHEVTELLIQRIRVLTIIQNTCSFLGILWDSQIGTAETTCMRQPTKCVRRLLS